MESNDSPESSRDPDSQGIEELANAANSISPLRDEHKELRTRYDDICGRLNVNLATSSRGWELLSRIPTPENVSATNGHLFTIWVTLTHCSRHMKMRDFGLRVLYILLVAPGFQSSGQTHQNLMESLCPSS